MKRPEVVIEDELTAEERRDLSDAIAALPKDGDALFLAKQISFLRTAAQASHNRPL